MFSVGNRSYMTLEEMGRYLGFTYETVKSNRHKHPDRLPPASIDLGRPGWLQEDVDRWLDAFRPVNERRCFMTLTQVAAYVGIRAETVEYFLKKHPGYLPEPYEIFGKLRYDKKEIDEWIRTKKQKTAL